MSIVVIVLALGAAFAFALSSSLKHMSATESAIEEVVPRRLGRFVLDTLAHPLWLGGIACDVLGVSLQVFALHFGALALIQPLLISGMLFALLLRQRFDPRSVSIRQLSWAALLTASLVVFVLLAAPGSGSSVASGVDRGPAVTAGALAVMLALVCVLLGTRQRVGGRSAALLGVAVGVFYAAGAALLKGVTDILASSPERLLYSWQFYAVIAVGAGGLMLNQLAFRSGPLSASLPATSAVDPLLSIVVGVAVYDEHINSGPWAGSALVLLLTVMGAAVIQLSRSATSAEKVRAPMLVG